MFQIFTDLASWITYTVLNLSPDSRWGDSVHFFIEDISKIFVLLILMIYVIALLRASLNVEKVRDYLATKHHSLGYVLGASFGAITPFCSCSSIPVFLGFISAGIPLGITMAFLITSPLINEVAVLLLISLLGWKFTLLYVISGLAIGILGGVWLDKIKAERWLQDFAANALKRAQQHTYTTASPTQPSLSWAARHQFAKQESIDIFTRVWKWVIIGVSLGALLHGWVPEGYLQSHLGQGQWWTVPAAVLLGIPLYANATGIIPVMESLLTHGLPMGTTLAFCMSTVAASFPEFMLLKQVMQWRLLAILFALLLCAFTLVGWLLNALASFL